jgi:hypothetical protein
MMYRPQYPQYGQPPQPRTATLGAASGGYTPTVGTWRSGATAQPAAPVPTYASLVGAPRSWQGATTGIGATPLPGQAPQPGDYLPYTEELNASMGRLGGLIDEVSKAEAPQRFLDAATYGARQEAAARGLEGGVAASLGTSAQGQVRNAWEDQRYNRMSSLLSQQIGAITGIQGAEQQRRMLLAQLEAARAAGDQEKAAGIWKMLGTLGGAAIGGVLAIPTGGLSIPMGIGLGASLGGTGGSLLGNLG